MLFLTKNDYDKILKHCEAGLPDEACGLIGGTKDGNDKYIKESPSRPSEEDKRLAYDSKVNYLILSLMDRENPVLKAFIIDEEKNVTIEEIKITE